jgi:hypothetical protein
LLQVVLASCRLRRRSILPTCVLFRTPLLETRPRPPPSSSSGSNKNPTPDLTHSPAAYALQDAADLGCDFPNAGEASALYFCRSPSPRQTAPVAPPSGYGAPHGESSSRRQDKPHLMLRQSCSAPHPLEQCTYYHVWYQQLYNLRTRSTDTYISPFWLFWLFDVHKLMIYMHQLEPQF